MRPCQHFLIPPQPPGRGAEGEPADAYSPRRVLQESVPEATVHTLRELGAFRLQVRLSLNVFPICKTVNILFFRFPMRWTVQCGPYHTNTQCARLTEFIGGNGLDVGIFIGVHQSTFFNHKGVCVQDSMIALQKLKSTRIQGRRPRAMCSTAGMNSSTSASLGSQTWPATPSQLWL